MTRMRDTESNLYRLDDDRLIECRDCKKSSKLWRWFDNLPSSFVEYACPKCGFGGPER